MVRQTKAQREWRPDQPKKPRSIYVMFASAVLTLEAFVVFFATLVSFGLRQDMIPGPVIIIGGLLFSGVLIASCAFLTKPWGTALGWILQVLLIALGFVEPMMFVVGAMFAGAWWYAVVTGKRLDRENKERAAQEEALGKRGTGPKDAPPPVSP